MKLTAGLGSICRACPAQKNKAVISSINRYFETEGDLVEIIREIIKECFRDMLVVQVQDKPPAEILSGEENELMDSLDMFLGG